MGENVLIIGRAGGGKTTFARAYAQTHGLKYNSLDDTPYDYGTGVVNEGFPDTEGLKAATRIILVETPYLVTTRVYQLERPNRKYEHCATQYDALIRLVNSLQLEVEIHKTTWWVGTAYDEPIVDIAKWCENFTGSASWVADLLCLPRDAIKKANGELGDTAKTLLRTKFLSKKYGVFKTGESKYTEKGNRQEGEALQVIADYFSTELQLKPPRIFTEYFSGECDAIGAIYGKKTIIDAKCSYDLFTFNEAKITEKKVYAVQMQIYMYLYKCTHAKVCYVLLDTPDDIIQSSIRKMEYLAEAQNKTPEWVATQRANIIRLGKPEGYIPLEERLHIVSYEYNSDLIKEWIPYVERARLFLKTLL